MFFEASETDCNSCGGHTIYRSGKKLKNELHEKTTAKFFFLF